MTQTIQLQAIGTVPAVKAETIKAGDILMWNFGQKYSVDEILKDTGKSIVIKTTYLANGNTYEQRLMKNRLVAKVN